jgi:hypothetical protein
MSPIPSCLQGVIIRTSYANIRELRSWLMRYHYIEATRARKKQSSFFKLNYITEEYS